ncbi:MAG: hypothetical protein GQ564_05950 [Bacteroidales bacterium]|nr:hypothetical protein [Bacteroidales bacterium]
MKNIFNSKNLTKVLYLISFICLGITVSFFLQYKFENTRLIKVAEKEIEGQAGAAGYSINGKLGKIQNKVDYLVEDLSKESPYEQGRLLDSLRGIMYSNPAFVEVGIAYKPFAYDENIRLFGVAYILEKKQLKHIRLDEKQDYTDPEVHWYNEPINKGALWLEPVFDQSRKEMLVTYAAPLIRKVDSTNHVIGVFYLTISFDFFSRALNKLDLGERGYSFLVSSNSRYILYPDISYLGKSGHETGPLKWITNKSSKISPNQSPSTDKSIFQKFIDKDTRLESFLFLKAIPITSWQLGVSFVRDDYVMSSFIAKRKIVHIRYLLGIAILFFVIPFMRMHKQDTEAFWKLSIAYSVFCFYALLTILQATLTFPAAENYDRKRITHQYSLNQFKLEHTKQSMYNSNNLPLFIPTGVYIQSITFLNANNVRLTGYIWQRYTDGIHNSISRGFVMPESEDAEIEQAYHQKIDDNELIGWKFRVILNEKFDYAHFPFARENIWIQLWHKDFYRNVILIPDLEDYQQTNPSALPGLLQGLEIPGWELESTYFSYRIQSYKTNFGLKDYSGLTNFPELFFNIHIVKEITDPLVTHIIPISVIIIMLFAILLLTNKDARKKGLLGFNTMSVIASCAGFFLVVVFSHIDFREGLSTKGIVYIEYYYFITYVLILSVALNSLIYSLTDNRFVHYKNNKLVQMLFLPVILTIILLLTLMNFY